KQRLKPAGVGVPHAGVTPGPGGSDSARRRRSPDGIPPGSLASLFTRVGQELVYHVTPLLQECAETVGAHDFLVAPIDDGVLAVVVRLHAPIDDEDTSAAGAAPDDESLHQQALPDSPAEVAKLVR